MSNSTRVSTAIQREFGILYVSRDERFAIDQFVVLEVGSWAMVDQEQHTRSKVTLPLQDSARNCNTTDAVVVVVKRAIASKNYPRVMPIRIADLHIGFQRSSPPSFVESLQKNIPEMPWQEPLSLRQ